MQAISSRGCREFSGRFAAFEDEPQEPFAVSENVATHEDFSRLNIVEERRQFRREDVENFQSDLSHLRTSRRCRSQFQKMSSLTKIFSRLNIVEERRQCRREDVENFQCDLSHLRMSRRSRPQFQKMSPLAKIHRHENFRLERIRQD